MIERAILLEHYVTNRQSMQEIATKLNCSPHKVVYWMEQYRIPRRSISDAVYQRSNPNGDPFKIKIPTTPSEMKLWGLGMGLYWGEGTKASKHSVKLGNTDPALLRTFMFFLTELFGVDKTRFRFALQVFTDIDVDEALRYWVERLDVSPTQFYKPTVTISGSIGTYRRKSQYGVVTVHFHNKKLRDILVRILPR